MRPISVWICRTLVVLSALSGCGKDASAGPANVPGSIHSVGAVTGEIRDGYFYPQFQQWTIIEVTPARGVQMSLDTGDIPIILRGKSVFLSAGYMTLPSLDRPGDIVMPACFTRSGTTLTVTPIDGHTDPKPTPFTLRQSADQLQFVYSDVFDVTLEHRDLRADGGNCQRELDAGFNARLDGERSAYPPSICVLEPVNLSPLAYDAVQSGALEDKYRTVVPSERLNSPVVSAKQVRERRQPTPVQSTAPTAPIRLKGVHPSFDGEQRLPPSE